MLRDILCSDWLCHARAFVDALKRQHVIAIPHTRNRKGLPGAIAEHEKQRENYCHITKPASMLTDTRLATA